jgi:hypothetical protein
MSSVLEDRLTAALQARAELVHSDELHHVLPPASAPARLRRRPAVVALVAAACVVAVVVPLASRDHHTTEQPLELDHRWPPAPDHQVPDVTLTDQLSGDVDGDGLPDRIRVSGQTLTVTLAADPGHPLTRSTPDLQGLVGLAAVGGPGQAVVESIGDLVQGASWETVALRRGELERVPVHQDGGAARVSVVPGAATSWITPQGVLMTGALDPMQEGARHLAVRVSRVDARPGHPVLTPVGRWCWDVVDQPVPVPCPSGVDDAYDPGPHGSLPTLLPWFDTARRTTTYDAWQDGSTSLHMEEGPVHTTSVFKQAFDVVGTIDGHHVSAPAGVFDPGVLETFVDLGHGVRGLVVLNDASSWKILSFVDDRLVTVSVTASSGVRPGATGVLDEQGAGHPVDTWIGPQGDLFSTVQTGGIGQDELIRWQVTDGSGSTLVADDLGPVCIDRYWGTYGTC